MTASPKKNPPSWTETELSDLKEAVKEFLFDWHSVSERVGRTPMSCRFYYYNHLDRKDRVNDVNLPPAARTLRQDESYFWTEIQIADLLRMRDIEKKPWHEIDRVLGRSGRSKYSELKQKERREAPAAEIAARPVLAPLPEHKTLTAFLLGDPLPGRSAQDRKLGISFLETKNPSGGRPDSHGDVTHEHAS